MPSKLGGTGLFDGSRAARRRLRGWVLAAAAAVLGLRLLAGVAPVLQLPELALLDRWQALRATEKPSAQVAIVAVDETSIRALGPTPWPRNEWVPLIDRLAADGAKVIALDITFGPLEREAANTALLAEAMKKAGNVVFGFEFMEVGDPSPPGVLPSPDLLRSGIEIFQTLAPPAPDLIDPEPSLVAAAAGVGHVITSADEDGIIRRLPLFIRHGDRAFPSLALQAARVFEGTPPETIDLQMDHVDVGDAFRVPVTRSGEALVAWPAEGEKAFPIYSFIEVVKRDPRVPEHAFRGKAVLVAGTAAGLDDRDFPFASEAPGVLLHANFLDNFLRLDFVRIPTWGWMVEWALVLVLLGVGVWLLPRVPTPQLLAGVPVLALALLVTAALLYVGRQGIWLPVVYPLLSLLVPAGTVIVARLRTSEKQTETAAAESAEAQKLLGLSFQEKGMLDLALATFSKLPLDHEMKRVHMNLALDYENRGQREKAFQVYRKIFDDDPTFEDVASRVSRLGQATGMTVVPVATAAGAGGFVWEQTAPSAKPGRAPTPPTQGDMIQLTERASGTLIHGSVNLDSTSPSAGAPATAGPGAPMPGTYASAGTYAPDTGRTGQPVGTMMSTGGSAVPAPAPGMPIVVGGRFGRYEVEKHLGRGGMGDVYLVRDVVLNRRAALKTIRADNGLDPRQAIEMRQRFYREAQTAGRLAHPNIVTVYDVGEENGTSFIVMEFVEGVTLSSLMEQRRLDLAQIQHVIFHTAVALNFAHQNGVFHRDIKPDNIMINRAEVVKVMDFGIARIAGSDLTKTGSVMGTPSYMSPEQFSGKKIDHRSDIFSLGVILYEVLTGTKPFKGDSMHSLMFAILQGEPPMPSTLDARLNPAWDAILRRCLAKDPDQRYGSAQELAEAIRRAPTR